MFEDVPTTFYAAIVSSALGAAIPVAAQLFEVVGTFFVTTTVVTDPRDVRVLDRDISERGYSTRRLAGAGRFPAEGIHIAWSFGLALAVKKARISTMIHDSSTYMYTVYTFGRRATRRLEQITAGNPSEIRVNLITYIGSGGNYANHGGMIKAPGEPWAWQATVIDMIMAEFAKTTTVSVLVTGRPGVGKSSLAEVLSVKFASQACQASIIKHYDPTQTYPDVFSVVQEPTFDKPTILLIDEYDSIVVRAEKENKRSEMLGALDILARISHVVVLATTNAEIASIDERYTRRGRFNLHLAVEDDEVKVLQQ